MPHKDAEKRLAYHRAYNTANKEKLAAQNKAYQEANAEKVKATHKAYYESHKEAIKAHGQSYRLANRDKQIIRSRTYYMNNRDKQAAYMAVYRAANLEKLKGLARVRVYGLSPESFQVMIDQQNHKCCICAVELTSPPHVDHDHDTGQVRGLLCRLCNLGLGHFEQDRTMAIATLRAAADYLEFWYSQADTQLPLLEKDV